MHAFAARLPTHIPAAAGWMSKPRLAPFPPPHPCAPLAGCHSGTLLDHPVVTIAGPKDGEAVPNLSGVMGMLLGRGVDPEGDVEGAREIKNRALPTQSFLSMLSSQLGAGVGKGNIRASLTQLFGNASSAKVRWGPGCGIRLAAGAAHVCRARRSTVGKPQAPTMHSASAPCPCLSQAINYSQLMGQGSAAMGMAQKGDFSGCVPLLGVSAAPPALAAHARCLPHPPSHAQ